MITYVEPLKKIHTPTPYATFPSTLAAPRPSPTQCSHVPLAPSHPISSHPTSNLHLQSPPRKALSSPSARGILCPLPSTIRTNKRSTNQSTQLAKPTSQAANKPLHSFPTRPPSPAQPSRQNPHPSSPPLPSPRPY